MLQILFSPKWFYGKDILIDLVSIIVLALISYMTFCFYQINKRKKQHLMLSWASSLLSLSFIFKIFTNFTLYNYVTTTKHIGVFTLTSHTVEYSDTLFLVGTLLYRLLTLIGFYILFSIYYKKQTKPVYLIMIFFIFISTYFTSQTYYVFHITTLLFLVFIVGNYYKNYLRTKDKAAKLIFLSFAIILASQFIFIFIGLINILYVIAEVIQLLGYVLLLGSFILVLNYGKKKK